MVCENCNKEIDEDSKFCLYCGNKVENHKLEKEIKAYFEKDILISNKVHSPRFGYNRSSGKVELDNIYIKILFITKQPLRASLKQWDGC